MQLRALLVGILLAMSIGTGAAFGQTDSGRGQSFDCVKVLLAAGFGSPADILADKRRESIDLMLPPDALTPTGDPINVDELLNGQEPFLQSGVGSWGGAEYQNRNAYCYLLIVEFRTTQKRDVLLDENGQFSNTPLRLPIILIDPSIEYNKEIGRYNAWSGNDFQISVKFPEFLLNQRQATFYPEYILEIKYFGATKYNSNNVWILDVDARNLPVSVHGLLGNAGALESNKLLVLCGRTDCDSISREIGDAAFVDERFGLAPGYPLNSIETVGSAVGTGEMPASGNDPSVTTAPPATPPPAVRSEPPREPEKIGIQMGATLFYIDKNGTDQSSSLQSVGDLSCVLHALNGDIFVEDPECSGNAFDALRKSDSLIEITDDNRWKVVHGARYPNPEEITVTLPEGQPSAQCQLDLLYPRDDGKIIEERFEPQFPQTNPARFVAGIRDAIKRDGNQVTFNIVVVGSAATCGGDTRSVSVEAARHVEVSLVENETDRVEVVHFLVLDREDLRVDLRLDQVRRRQFAQSLFEALQATHVRLSAQTADQISSLSRAQVMKMTSGGSQALIDLNADQLRSQVTDSFAYVDDYQLDQLAESSIPLTETSLLDALDPLVSRARIEGIDRLVITFLGSLTARNVSGLNDPCVAPDLRALADRYSAISTTEIEIVAIPLVPLLPEDRVDSWSLIPKRIDPNSFTSPGGLYQCGETPAGLSIYPFYFEPWRSPVEAAPRYATNVADELSAVLDDLL